MADWKETKAIFSELEQLFSREDDLHDVVDIKKMEREINEHCEQRLTDVREIIKAMTSMVSQTEKEITAPSQAEHLSRMKELVENDPLQRHLSALLQAVDERKVSTLEVQAMVKVLQERTQEYTINSSIADSRTAYAVSLYSKISNITWNYRAPEGHLAGYIANDAKKEFRNFDIDTAGKSSFEITNALWEMIDQATME